MESTHLESLRKRWEETPTPQLTLELAEGYRDAGEPTTAIEVLERAVAEGPEHLSTLVLLGRLRLETGGPAEAAEALERVVATDPTHLPANKLLVRAYSLVGDKQRATDRLDLYCMLNEDDPEVDELRALLEEKPVAVPTEAPAGEPAAAAAEEPATEPEEPVESAADGNGSQPFDLEALWAGLDEAGYRQALAAEGILFAPSTTAVEEEEATATLGELYEEQGHTVEAERIFRAVLEREPENAAALAGLERLAGAELAPAEENGGGLAARKAAMLKHYLGKLRRKGSTDV